MQGNVTINTIDNQWIINNIEAGRNTHQMGVILGCDREKVEAYIRKNGLWDTYSRANVSKMPHFVFHDPNIYEALSKFGPMCYSSCPAMEK